MKMLDIIIVLFIAMESANVLILYFFPSFKYGNGVSVFKGWEESKQDEAMHLFIKYMKNWVAGTKVIFIVLLILVLIFADDNLKVLSAMMMILSICTYYVGLHPIIRKLDKLGKLQQKGYSGQLFFMITGFILAFLAGLAYYYYM